MEDKKIKGRWWDIEKVQDFRQIEATYDRMKDWKMDPKGYFLIKIDQKDAVIRVGYCTFPDNKLRAEITGKTALDIINTLIRHEMISSLQHAADMGIELFKAQLALKHNLKYVQDGELEIG